MSPLIQNDIIEIIGQDMILKKRCVHASSTRTTMSGRTLLPIYSSASDNRPGNSGNDSVYFAWSWSGNGERQGSGVRWYG